jgi:hypothetical protein
MPPSNQDRRAFLASLAAVIPAVTASRPIAAGVEPSSLAHAARAHPDPRPGIDGAKVLAADRVPEDARAVYDGIRHIAPVADGIGCPCGCQNTAGMYSLLSCFEESGMARFCDICKGVGRLVVKLDGEGKTLDEIRAAVDRRRW